MSICGVSSSANHPTDQSDRSNMSTRQILRFPARKAFASPRPLGLARTASTSASAEPTAVSKADSPAGQSSPASSSTPDPGLLRIRPGPIYRPRLQQMYESRLSHDLLYMTYQLPAGHAADASTSLLENGGKGLTEHPDPVSKLPLWDPESPYSVNRPRRPPRGGSHALTRRLPPDSSPEHLPRLEKIAIDIHVPEGVHTRKELLGAILLLQHLTGELDRAALPAKVLESLPADRGIRIIKTRTKSGSFRLRKNMPCGVVVALKGPSMYAFLDSLTTFVLPRAKDFLGFRLPPADANPRTPNMNSGTVSIGLDRDSMGLWPGVEESLENWPRKYGMNIHFVTSAKGARSQEKA